MATGEHDRICVGDIGLSGLTIADGLAVGKPSGFVCRMMEHLASGAFTVSDEKLLDYQKMLMDLENIRVEPSACAGFKGLAEICRGGNEWDRYIKEHGLFECMDQAVHIVWATGGGLMPEDQ
jgi:D-serine dehydratase